MAKIFTAAELTLGDIKLEVQTGASLSTTKIARTPFVTTRGKKGARQ